MVGGFLVQMWPLFDQYLGGLKTVAVSFEEKSAIEFPDLAFCDSRTFKRKFATTSSVTEYTGFVNETPPEKEGKINTSKAEPVAVNSRAVGQFLSISCGAFI